MSFETMGKATIEVKANEVQKSVQSFDERLKDTKMVMNKVIAYDIEKAEKHITKVFNPDDRVEVNEKETPTNDKELQNKEIQSIEKKDLNLLSGLERGNYGEMKVDQDMESKGYERISDGRVTDRNSDTKPGIDGVYYKKDGEPKYIVLDAKFNSAELGKTLDGKQMCLNWVNNRLDDAVGKDTAHDIRKEMLFNKDNVGMYVAKVDLNGNVSYDKLDTKANVAEKGCSI